MVIKSIYASKFQYTRSSHEGDCWVRRHHCNQTVDKDQNKSTTTKATENRITSAWEGQCRLPTSQVSLTECAGLLQAKQGDWELQTEKTAHPTLSNYKRAKRGCNGVCLREMKFFKGKGSQVQKDQENSMNQTEKEVLNPVWAYCSGSANPGGSFWREVVG